MSKSKTIQSGQLLTDNLLHIFSVLSTVKDNNLITVIIHIRIL